MKLYSVDLDLGAVLAPPASLPGVRGLLARQEAAGAGTCGACGAACGSAVEGEAVVPPQRRTHPAPARVPAEGPGGAGSAVGHEDRVGIGS